jgi:hypothetical protein
VGEDLQGSTDDIGGNRPSGAPQRDPGVEPAELPPGGGEAVKGGPVGGVNGRPDRESERGPEAERDRWGGRNSSRPKAASFRFALPTGQRETDGNSNCRSRGGIIVAEG